MSEILLSAYCGCGEKLETFLNDNLDFIVTPCEMCLENARDEGRNEPPEDEIA